MTWKLTIAAGAALVLLPYTVVAQAPPAQTTPPAQTAPPNPDRATNCTPTEAVPQEGTVAPRDTTTGSGGSSLGDKLAQSDGVLCPPPGIDSQMHAPTPQGGPMPVIPPPGGPGGDPNVRPK